MSTPLIPRTRRKPVVAWRETATSTRFEATTDGVVEVALFVEVASRRVIRGLLVQHHGLARRRAIGILIDLRRAGGRSGVSDVLQVAALA